MKDLMGLMKQAKEMQKKMEEAQAKVADIVVEGRSGGGLVTVSLAGGGNMNQAVNRRELILGAGAGLALAACDAKTDVTQSLPPQINMTDMTPDKVRAALSGFAVNAESWWANLPFEERFAAAAEAGFSHVEFWFISSWDRDARALASQIKPTGLKVSQIVGDAPALGEAGTRELFLDNMKRCFSLGRRQGILRDRAV